MALAIFDFAFRRSRPLACGKPAMVLLRASRTTRSAKAQRCSSMSTAVNRRAREKHQYREADAYTNR